MGQRRVHDYHQPIEQAIPRLFARAVAINEQAGRVNARSAEGRTLGLFARAVVINRQAVKGLPASAVGRTIR